MVPERDPTLPAAGTIGLYAFGCPNCVIYLPRWNEEHS
jgi:hypothetical protein